MFIASVRNNETLTTDEKNNLIGQYESSYREIGVDPKLLINHTYIETSHCTALVIRNSENLSVGAILFRITEYGRKITYVTGISKEISTNVVMPLLAKLLKTKGWYAELSGPVEHILRRYYNLDNIIAKRVIIKVAGLASIYNGKNVFIDDYIYVKPRCMPIRLQQHDHEGKFLYGMGKERVYPPIFGTYIKRMGSSLGYIAKRLYGIPCRYNFIKSKENECEGVCASSKSSPEIVSNNYIARQTVSGIEWDPVPAGGKNTKIKKTKPKKTKKRKNKNLRKTRRK